VPNGFLFLITLSRALYGVRKEKSVKSPAPGGKEREKKKKERGLISTFLPPCLGGRLGRTGERSAPIEGERGGKGASAGKRRGEKKGIDDRQMWRPFLVH